MVLISRKFLWAATLIIVLLLGTLPAMAGVGELNQRVKQEKMGDATTGKPGSVTNTGGVGLNFRAAPWGNVKSVLPEGADLQILAAQGDWLKVKRGSETGFVHKNYVQKGGSSASPESGNYTVNVSNDSWAYLNVRSSPFGKIIGKAHKGDQMQVIGRQGEWLKVKHGGGTAWVHSDYMVKKSSSAGDKPAAGTSKPPATGKPATPVSKPGTKPKNNRNLATYYSNNYNQVRDAARRFWPNSFPCAAFASTALKMAGYPVKQVLLTNDVEKQLKGMGWQAVTNMNQLKPGDVVFTDKATSNVSGTYSHVYVYQGSAGPGYARVLDNYGPGFKRNIGPGGYSKSVIAYRPR